jgi:O-antigen/teichoic acid export membrane protein
MMLISGTAVAQLITAGAMPLLSRLYQPVEIGLLAVFTGLLTTFAVAVCLRFDVAVALPPADEDAGGLLLLSLIAAAGLSLLIAVPVLLLPERVAALLRQPGLTEYLWLLPLGIFSAGAYAALQTWNVRARAFPIVARARIGQAVIAAGVQIACGLAAVGVAGLIAGYALGFLCGALILGWAVLRHPPAGLSQLGKPGLMRLARRYSRFPRLSTWEALANNGAIQLPIVMIGAMAAPSEAGYLMWAIYVVQAPMGLVGNAVGQVYLSRAPAEHAAGNLPEFTSQVLGRLVAVGLGPLLAIGILAPTLFGFVFGPGWGRAGWLVAWMIPWFVLQFVASPISMALHVLERGHAAMAFQVYGLVLRVAVVVAAARLLPVTLSEVYAVSGAIVYGTLFFIVVRALGITTSRLADIIKRAMPVTIAWVVGALVVAGGAAVWGVAGR